MKQSELTKALIKDLKDDIEALTKLESNIEVIWALEKLKNNDAFGKSADLIRKSLQRGNQMV